MANWDNLANRGSVDDRRGISFAPVAGLGSLGILVVLGIALLGGDARTAQDVITMLHDAGTLNQTNQDSSFSDPEQYQVFASRVLGSTNEVFSTQLASRHITYREPSLVLFRDATNSACGGAYAAVGPHYCPIDTIVYLDERFFGEITHRFGGSDSKVAQAYVIAHEVGHHVQNQLGLLQNSHQSNQDAIQTELQADCLAGVWAGTVQHRGILEKSEINDAVDAAKAVGDDNIQSVSSGRVHPEQWTHGSSEQRKRAVLQGYESRDMQICLSYYK